ncbi:MAG: ABC transporter substrate-binding protein [Xanthobacteraceae bacterium]|nr:ABC transporter substrate-binding protein [Xanthobacteraceae bacterium]
MRLNRRTFVGGALAAPFLAKPGFGQAKGKVLRVIPHADLKNIDPIWTTAYISRNHGYMVFDTLFALDASLAPKPQMVESWEASADKKTWTFTLREGLSFHNGQPVTAEDCVASLQRWGKRDGMGQSLFASVESLTAKDKKTFEMKLSRPFGLVLEAIGKISSNVPFMMPKALAETDPFKQIPESIGSGPFMFKKDEWVPGSKVVYVKNPNYVPRKEPVSGASGGKVAKVDRVEWLYIPDSTTAMNALISGEVDYYEQVPGDLAPVLAKAPGIKLDVLDPLGSQGMMRFNHVAKPTDNALVRRAVIQAIKQQDVLAASVGNPQFYKICEAYFPCGSPLESNAGLDMIRPTSLDAAKKTLKESGYNGEKVVILQPSDIPISNAFALVVGKACRDIGMNVDIQAMDWSSVTSRRAKKDPIEQGGWNMFPTWWIGGDLLNPLISAAMIADPNKAWPGWPNDKKMEELRAQFATAASVDEQKKIAAEVQKRAIEIGTHANLGTFFVPVGYRENVKGMIPSPVQFFWNMEVG